MKHKGKQVVIPASLSKPFLGIQGLPDNITSIELLATKVDEPIKIRVEFFPNGYQIDQITQTLLVLTEEYELVKKGTYEIKK